MAVEIKSRRLAAALQAVIMRRVVLGLLNPDVTSGFVSAVNAMRGDKTFIFKRRVKRAARKYQQREIRGN